MSLVFCILLSLFAFSQNSQETWTLQDIIPNDVPLEFLDKNKSEHRYLDCDSNSPITITSQDNSQLSIEGVLKNSQTYEFKEINEGQLGNQGLYISFSHRKTTAEYQSEDQFKIYSQVRECWGFWGNSGCLFSSWHTTAELTLTYNEDNDPSIEFSYQPFTDIDKETCQFTLIQ